MSGGSSIGLSATALLSAAVGWWLHAASASDAPGSDGAPAPLAATTAAVPVPADTSPLIVVSSDGLATIRVENQPLERVLEQIAQAAGWPELRHLVQTARGAMPQASAPVDTPAGEAQTLSPAQTEQLLRTIRQGAEADRFDGLLQARNDGATVPDDLLKHLYETDASERVRLLAFEAYLEPRSDDSEETRRVLQSALYVPNLGIQREARRRLDELAEIERIDAASVQKATP